MIPGYDRKALLTRIGILESQLQERDSALDAIRRGDIDAVMVTQDPGDYRVFNLESADHPYRAFVERIGEGAITLNGNGMMLYGNPRLAAMLGLSEEQMVGRKLQPFLLPGDTEKFDQMLLEAGRVSVRGEVTLCSVGGARVHVHVSLSFLRNEGEARLLCGIVTDLSEQDDHLRRLTSVNTDLARLAEDLKTARDVADRASHAKSRFLAGVTHELRTPLNGILGYAQLLQLEGGLNAVQLARVDAMLSTGGHLREMINSVLDLAALENGHVQAQLADVELHKMAEACLDLVHYKAEEKGLAVGLTVSPEVPHLVLTDRTRLLQVLLNLLGNAVKFTAAGRVDLHLRIARACGYLRIEVADTGPGIPIGLRDRLFQDFERLGAGGVVEGAGLGLALSARLARLMDWHIGYEDNPVGGSIFWLEIPLVAVDQALTLPTAAVVADTTDKERSLAAPQLLHVLVVDDVAMNREIAGAFLRSGGHHVTYAEGGAESVALASDHDFDVILMDIRMPGMDGLEASRSIRMLAGSRGQVPIMALTAQAFAEQVTECHSAGMDNHLSKPFTPEGLLAAVTLLHAEGRRHRAAAPQ